MTTLSAIKDAIYAIGNRIINPIKARVDIVNEEASADIDAAIALVDSNYGAIKAAIEAKDVDMTGVKPSGYDEKIAIIAAPDANGWVRPSDWLFIDTIPEGTQKLIALAAVFDGHLNHFAISCQGAYTVDWGDGSAPQNYASGATAEYAIDYADLDADTLCSLGYRQALIVITPQAGQNLTVIDFRKAFTGSTRPHAWLDILCRASLLASLYVGSDIAAAALTRYLERFVFFGDCNLTSLDNAFATCPRLQSVDLTGLIGINSAIGAFRSCRLLRVAPDLDATAIANATYMFYDCQSLVTAKPYVFPATAPLTVLGMYWLCSSLVAPPAISIAAATSAQILYQACALLTEIPAINLSGVTSAAGLTGIFATSTYIKRVKAFGSKYSISVAGCNMQAAELNEFFTNLGTAAIAAQTITITGNPGAATCDQTIATAKGYTVVN